MDEFYLPEEIIEWLALKKSEYLSKLIMNVTADDIQFDEYIKYDELIPATLEAPDWTSEGIEDKQRVKTFFRTFSESETLHQVVIGALIADQEKKDVFIPILSYVTRNESIVSLFNAGKITRQTLN